MIPGRFVLSLFPGIGLLDMAFEHLAGKVKAVGNGVPMAMGRAIARAVKRAMAYDLEATA